MRKKITQYVIVIEILFLLTACSMKNTTIESFTYDETIQNELAEFVGQYVRLQSYPEEPEYNAVDYEAYKKTNDTEPYELFYVKIIYSDGIEKWHELLVKEDNKLEYFASGYEIPYPFIETELYQEGTVDIPTGEFDSSFEGKEEWIDAIEELMLEMINKEDYLHAYSGNWNIAVGDFFEWGKNYFECYIYNDEEFDFSMYEVTETGIRQYGVPCYYYYSEMPGVKEEIEQFKEHALLQMSFEGADTNIPQDLADQVWNESRHMIPERYLVQENYDNYSGYITHKDETGFQLDIHYEMEMKENVTSVYEDWYMQGVFDAIGIQGNDVEGMNVEELSAFLSDIGYEEDAEAMTSYVFEKMEERRPFSEGWTPAGVSFSMQVQYDGDSYQFISPEMSDFNYNQPEISYEDAEKIMEIEDMVETGRDRFHQKFYRRPE